MNKYYFDKFNESRLVEKWLYGCFRETGYDLQPFTTREEQFHGENAAGIEFKTSSKASYAYQAYVELEEKSDASNNLWIKSGLFKDDNTEFIFWFNTASRTYIIFRKSDLQEFYNRNKRSIYHSVSPTSTGILVSFYLDVSDKKTYLTVNKLGERDYPFRTNVRCYLTPKDFIEDNKAYLEPFRIKEN